MGNAQKCERGNAQNLSSTLGNSQKVKGCAQVEVRAMPKMCEKGYAQNPSGLNGNSQDVKGYAQVKVRAMPRTCPSVDSFLCEQDLCDNIIPGKRTKCACSK